MAANSGSGGPAGPAGPAGPQTVAYEVDAPNAYKWTEVAYDYLLAGKLTARHPERRRDQHRDRDGDVSVLRGRCELQRGA